MQGCRDGARASGFVQPVISRPRREHRVLRKTWGRLAEGVQRKEVRAPGPTVTEQLRNSCFPKHELNTCFWGSLVFQGFQRGGVGKRSSSVSLWPFHGAVYGLSSWVCLARITQLDLKPEIPKCSTNFWIIPSALVPFGQLPSSMAP